MRGNVMADPTEEGTPLPPDETESGRAKHVAPLDEETTPDHPAVARAAAGPDAAPDAEPAEGPTIQASPAPVAAEPAPIAAEPAAVPARTASDATETREEPVAAPVDEAGGDEDRADQPTAVLPAEDRQAPPPPPPPPPATPQRRVPVPAATEAPPPPRRGSNRLVGTAWVLLAALLFEVLYIAAFALLVCIVDGSQQVGQAVQSLVTTPFVWLPLVLFALLYELTVLLLNRAGRFAYVLSSLVVALIVYVLSAVLILAMQQGGVSNENNLGRALIVPQVVLIPLIAREVMLWTGLAIGARGRRVRKRNREAQAQYE